MVLNADEERERGDQCNGRVEIMAEDGIIYDRDGADRGREEEDHQPANGGREVPR